MKKNFPITTHITSNDMLGNVNDIYDCIGARALKRVLEERNIPFTKVIWATDIGYIENNHRINSYNNMMLAKEGEEVTFYA